MQKHEHTAMLKCTYISTYVLINYATFFNLSTVEK